MLLPRFKYISPKRLDQLKRDQGSREYQQWRSQVLKRDDNQCQFDGCKCKEKLQIHHIRRHTDAIHLRTAVWNGITLCEKHHRGIYGQERMYELKFFRIVDENERKQRQNNPDPSGHAGTRPPTV